ncbi:MAG TPA: sigma-70 family RNA polymerase sigma factor [Candidatus Dormibacteraeota bacterium]|nr:sigma-70 family RNA polymerase sigma factor [Candidatus Dormibacteraeota bacterium]
MGAERDAELTTALARDLGSGFETTVRTFQHRLYAFALGMTGEPADAEEVAQDTFVRAHAALKRYPPERIRSLKLNAWLHEIALNVVRNRVRRRSLRLVPIEPEQPVADAAPGPEATALSNAALRELANLVSGLPEQQRSAVVLRCVQGMTYAEVAAQLGQPEGTVKSNVHRGLQALRRRAGWLSEVS